MKTDNKFIGFFKNCFNKVGTWFKNFFGHFRGFNTLVVMQLKDKLNMSFKADKKGTLTKAILYFVLLGAMTAIIYLIFMVLGMLGVLGLDGTVPISIFNVFFFFIFILNTISCLLRLTNSLFFSADNQVLLTYPVKGDTIFLSKLTVFYLLEIIKNFTFLVPLFLAYGIVNNFQIVFYPWLIFCFFILALLPVALSSLLSIPVMYIKMFLKKYQIIESVFFLSILVGITVFIFWVVTLIPEDLKIAAKRATDYFPAITNFTAKVEIYFMPLVYLSGLIMGYKHLGNNSPRNRVIFTDQTGIIFLIIVAIIVILFVVSSLLAKPLFFKMASKPFEYKKKKIKHSYVLTKLKTSEFSEKVLVLDGFSEKKANYKVLKYALRVFHKENHFVNFDEMTVEILSEKLKVYLPEYDFGLVEIDSAKESKLPYITLRNDDGIKTFVAVSESKVGYSCYDPKYLKKKNVKLSPFLTSFFVEIHNDFRTPGNLVGNYLLFIITPIAILILNSVFKSMKSSYQGEIYTVLFNTLIISLIVLASNVSIASVYSREGNANYLLKASPVNYTYTLVSKLLIKVAIVVGSLIFAIVIYDQNKTVDFIRPELIFFSVLFLYIGHILWSAELDYMNPKEKLYQENGEGVTNNSNETLSAIIAFITSFAYAFLTYFFISENMLTGFVKVMLICLAFMLARIWLFYTKVKAYGTSRSERSNN